MTEGPRVPAPGSDDIEGRIREAYAELTARERVAADFMLEHVADLAVFSATEIADSSGVSKATVSRLFRSLGYADAQELRDQARALRGRGVPVATGPTGDLAEHLRSEQAALERMVAGLADGRLETAAGMIAAAREVVVAGFRNSYPVALHLRQQLAQARPRVRVAPAPGQSVGEELAGLDARDVVVLVGFRRRPAGFAAVVAALQSRGVPLVVLADPALRLPVTPDTVVLPCPVDGISAFDSYAAPMSLANLLAAAVLGADSRAGRTRVAAITALYDELGELE
ncbi:RpiR family transcriptional regulator [Frondihabitans sp. PhB188]|uniref:MurR/RpiR family transcriptional regulator n=1 Tax=Frondihabitans sp. PhB188 TaxID=2485200 RepID=UPI000F46B883|nr:MurR/RpiR family transcriptional regulator [Frondihabitans sp. PhB188]ROQ40110.1 RpiR family transcriptional regulator [Frondihabitans sp. PhB188]